MRYFLKLSYNGSPFHGWQSQPNAESVQSSIEDALAIVLREKTSITGAGRTDTGVHAKEMFAHFDTGAEIRDKNRFILSLNSLVGKNIAIQDLIEVAEDAHARFDATERTYKYFISFQKNPFQKELCWKISGLDMDKMNEAAQFLLGRQDFTSFAKLHSDVKTNICDVRKAEWKLIDDDPEALEFMGNLGGGMVFTIAADRFLRNMVRAVVGTLIEVGRGKISLSQFRDIIEKKDRCAAGSSVPPEALFLWKVRYPYI